MAEPYELPEDITTLSNEDLDTALNNAIEAFETKRQTATTRDVDTLSGLVEGIKAMRDEQGTRRKIAEEAAAKLDQLSVEVYGEPEVEAAAEVEAEPEEPVAAAAPESEPEAVAASTVVARRPALDLSTVRRAQPRPVVQQTAKPTIEISAAVDVPGYQPGKGLDMDGVVEGIIRRASGLKTAGGGVGMVASYTLPFENDLIVTDASSAPEGSTAVMRAADQRRLNGGDLVASGGWCAPSETVYDITDISCPDMLWDAPEVQLARGGLRFFRTPALNVNALTFVHTEADDIAGATKPCFKIPCPAPIDVRCEAIGVCLEAGILTQRFFPELISWYLRNSMVAHEIRVRSALYEQARAQATAVTIPVSFASFSAVYGAVALQAADLIEKYSLCERIGLEVVFPWWMRNMMLADIARQQGKDVCDLDANCIQNAFSTLGVRVQWARGLTPDVPTNIGGPTAATAWPADMEFMIYPAGAFQIGRGAEVNLGVIHDSTKFATNDYTALFMEECAALLFRGPEARRVTVPVCASGQVGSQVAATCPVA